MISTKSTETLTDPNLPIWKNSTFNDGEASCSNLNPNFIIESFDSEFSKNDQIPPSFSSWLESSVSLISDPIRFGNVQDKPPKDSCEAPSTNSKIKSGVNQINRDIDAEIEDLEKEIGRVSTKLESLRLEKAKKITPAKCMESQKQKKIEALAFAVPNSRTFRRGVSLGPREILSAAKRFETVTPLKLAQNRRKSCFFKLPGIEEGKETKAEGRTSPRSRKAAATVGTKRVVKKEEGFISSNQPKNLFKEDQIVSRQPLKPARVVASKYSQMSKTQTKEKENVRASDENRKSEGRLKKKLEIPPSELNLLYRNGVNVESPIRKELPKIRTLPRAGHSPRDSGAAKRVAELESKNRNFTFCQLLRFEE